MTALRIGRLDCDVAIGVATRVALAGRLDDSTALGELIARLPVSGAVTIDTDGVTFVNSIGLREWTLLVRVLSARGQQLTLERIADVLIMQMNLIPEFRASARIASFHAQYVCLACGDETTPLIDALLHADALRALSLPALPCKLCGGTTELGDFPERYAMIFADA